MRCNGPPETNDHIHPALGRDYAPEHLAHQALGVIPGHRLGHGPPANGNAKAGGVAAIISYIKDEPFIDRPFFPERQLKLRFLSDAAQWREGVAGIKQQEMRGLWLCAL